MDRRTANGIISSAKVIGLIILIAGVAIASAIAPMDVAIVVSVILTIGFLGFATGDYGPQGCLTAIWGVVKYVLLLAILLLVLYAFMMMR